MTTFTTDKTGAKDRKAGSVLMETVIAIPLFMILLGGVMWLGDMLLARQQLLIADRYAAWNKGCRYDPGGFDEGTIHSRFFESSTYRNPSVATERQDFDWCLRARGRVQLTMKMPDWTRFMFNAGSIMYGTGVPTETVFLRGRSFGGSHAVLMRTKAEADSGYIRNRYGIPESGQLAVRWRDVYNEKWPYN